MRALVIERDEQVAQLTKRLLESEGFGVDIALTARDGDQFVRANDYAMIVLHMTLPDGDAMAILGIIRERSTSTPILIVSEAGNIGSTVSALDHGADDYLYSPYDAEELTARVRTLLRRGHSAESPIIECGNVALHRIDRNATVAGARLNLTAKEFALLEHFVMNRGKTLTRAELLKKVWRFDFDPGTNVVDVNVSRLRAKLVDLGASCHLDAERGVGYVFMGEG